jgi:hypothetical protein
LTLIATGTGAAPGALVPLEGVAVSQFPPEYVFTESVHEMFAEGLNTSTV